MPPVIINHFCRQLPHEYLLLTFARYGTETLLPVLMSERRDAAGFPLHYRTAVFGSDGGLRALRTADAGNECAGVVLVKVRHVLGGPATCGAEALALFSPHAGILAERCSMQ